MFYLIGDFESLLNAKELKQLSFAQKIYTKKTAAGEEAIVPKVPDKVSKSHSQLLFADKIAIVDFIVKKFQSTFRNFHREYLQGSMFQELDIVHDILGFKGVSVDQPKKISLICIEPNTVDIEQISDYIESCTLVKLRTPIICVYKYANRAELKYLKQFEDLGAHIISLPREEKTALENIEELSIAILEKFKYKKEDVG